jgi:hypothetical protein
MVVVRKGRLNTQYLYPLTQAHLYTKSHQHLKALLKTLAKGDPLNAVGIQPTGHRVSPYRVPGWCHSMCYQELLSADKKTRANDVKDVTTVEHLDIMGELGKGGVLEELCDALAARAILGGPVFVQTGRSNLLLRRRIRLRNSPRTYRSARSTRGECHSVYAGTRREFSSIISVYLRI